MIEFENACKQLNDDTRMLALATRSEHDQKVFLSDKEKVSWFKDSVAFPMIELLDNKLIPSIKKTFPVRWTSTVSLGASNVELPVNTKENEIPHEKTLDAWKYLTVTFQCPDTSG